MHSSGCVHSGASEERSIYSRASSVLDCSGTLTTESAPLRQDRVPSETRPGCEIEQQHRSNHVHIDDNCTQASSSMSGWPEAPQRDRSSIIHGWPTSEHNSRLHHERDRSDPQPAVGRYPKSSITANRTSPRWPVSRSGYRHLGVTERDDRTATRRFIERELDLWDRSLGKTTTDDSDDDDSHRHQDSMVNGPPQESRVMCAPWLSVATTSEPLVDRSSDPPPPRQSTVSRPAPSTSDPVSALFRLCHSTADFGQPIYTYTIKNSGFSCLCRMDIRGRPIGFNSVQCYSTKKLAKAAASAECMRYIEDLTKVEPIVTTKGPELDNTANVYNYVGMYDLERIFYVFH